MKPIKIGSRTSPLALLQVEEVLKLLKEAIAYEHLGYATTGDCDKQTSLTRQGRDDFFTDTIDQAILNKEIDVGVHSAKDVPRQLREGLSIFALTPSLDEADAWIGKFALSDMPDGVRIGTSSVLRQSQIKQMYPQARIVDIRGTIQERISLIRENVVDGIVVAACALKRLNLAHMITDLFPWEGMPLQGQLAVIGRGIDTEIMKLFESIDVRRTYGKVTLVGAGPGDPGLITMKGVDALGRADSIFYDYLVNSFLLNYAPQAEHVFAGKRKGEHALSQDQLNRELRKKAISGKNVVRLKGGDPLIFGRGADEISYLSDYHIQVDVIPGITSATGILSSLSVPLTARGVSKSVAFVSAHEEDDDKKDHPFIRIPKADTIVFLMGLTKLPSILSSLKHEGYPQDTPILIVSKGTCFDQQVIQGTAQDITLKVEESKIKPPALIITGNVVHFYKDKKIKLYLHCGSNPELYSNLGSIIPWPMIDIKAVDFNDGQLDSLVLDFEQSDMIVLTSPNAVKYFMRCILKLKTLRQVNEKIIIVIGMHTLVRLKEHGVNAQIIASYETAQGLLETLLRVTSLAGKKILFPRSELPNPFLKEALINNGAMVAEYAIYHNQKPSYRPLPEFPIDGIVFTSPSTVTNFLHDYKLIPQGWEILSKGSVTQAVLENAGYKSRIMGQQTYAATI